MTDDARAKTLSEIVRLAETQGISAKEISVAMDGAEPATEDRHMRFFAYLGGIFIFSGIAAFAYMFWNDMNSATRVIISLGSGVVLFLLGLVTAQDARYRKASTPLLLLSAVLQPTGLFVLLHEYFPLTNDARHAILFVAGVMLVQQACCWVATRRAVLLFFALASGAAFFSTLFDLMHVSEKWNAIVVGLSLMCLAYTIARHRKGAMSEFWLFVGSSMFLGGLFSVMEKSAIEPAYIAATGILIYVSTVIRSTMLLVTTVLAMLCYIAYFTEKHFVHSIGWPASLIVLGFVFIGIAAGAVRLKKKFI